MPANKQRSQNNNKSISAKTRTSIWAQITYSKEPSLDLYRLKAKTKPQNLIKTSREVLGRLPIFEKTYGPAFPKVSSEMFSRTFLYQPAGETNELIWAIARCLNHSESISRFIIKRAQLEEAVLADDSTLAESLLNEVERDFGVSLWLYENRMCSAYMWGGLTELYAKLESIQAEKKIPSIASNILKFIGARIESTQDFTQQKQALEQAFSEIDYKTLEKYFEARVFGVHTASPSVVSPLLFCEAHASIIDLYEALIASLQVIASIDELPDAVGDVLVDAVSSLYQATKDTRILSVARAFGLLLPEAKQINELRAACIEHYTIGRYDECVKAASAVLEKSPSDMSIFVLMHKSAVRSGATEMEYGSGILGKVSKHLSTMLLMRSGTYSALHEILKITDRFINHQWSAYLRAAVLYEIRQEGESFPPLWLRDLFVRDLGYSPFSAVAAPKKIQNLIIEDPELRERYPATLNVYLAATRGQGVEDDANGGHRLNKHLALFHLNNGSPGVALDYYNRILGESTGIDRIRTYSCLAVAHIALNNLGRAAEIAVDAFVENSDIPTCLPLGKIISAVDKLGPASKWPKTMSLPIVFELYHEYQSSDKLANLRISFEQFQLDNGIDNPSQLWLRGEKKSWKELYLSRVWRPDVMRQTLLYQNSREIEEARIKVCQFLAKIDPANEDDYFDEIKERVKKIEIAKGLKLVEQNKVYVDIPAIKRVVAKKLENPYKHYKSIQNNAPQSERVAEAIAATLTQAMPGKSLEVLLGGVHILTPEGATEETVQFNSMYSEIRNEFLFGAHGLNAYLSTRVRHGVLANTLRKPVEDDKLVTQKNETGEGYKSNEFWRLKSIALTGLGDQEIIDEAIQIFSRDFDAILDELKDEILQVRIVDKLSEKIPSKALFLYHSSNIERLMLKSRDRQGKSLDYFVDKCVDHLWSKTDEILSVVQRHIDEDVREELQSAFERLLNKIQGVKDESVSSALCNAISLARTNTQVRLDTVASWFKRSEVYDRQDYPPDFPVEVAHNMIRNTISHASNWKNIDIQVADGSDCMPGRTLDAMVYAFYGLIENAIKRSGVDMASLRAKILLEFKGERFSVKMINNLNLDRITKADIEKIARIRQEIDSEESNSLAQREGLSGLHKVWIAANGPFYANPSIDFGVDNSDFFVNLSFNVGKGV